MTNLNNTPSAGKVSAVDFGTYWPAEAADAAPVPAEASTEIGSDEQSRDNAMEMLGVLLLAAIALICIGCLALLVWSITT